MLKSIGRVSTVVELVREGISRARATRLTFVRDTTISWVLGAEKLP